MKYRWARFFGIFLYFGIMSHNAFAERGVFDLDRWDLVLSNIRTKAINDRISITTIDDTKSNYLEVLYVPLFVRVYSSYSEDNSTLNISSFVCAPVKVFTTTYENSNYSADLAKSFADKKVTYSFDNSNLTIC